MLVFSILYLMTCHAGIFYTASLATNNIQEGSPRKWFIYGLMLYIFALTYWVALDTAHLWQSSHDKFFINLTWYNACAGLFLYFPATFYFEQQHAA
ncbi:hypothetical protein PMZ80_002394 [Knufia obscura]|uniref:Uncharacterized protein n=2 Tax=Knufia TaxID=430999 RepID=A0AAN8I3K7_9EURO|nr:hypothetical protein PMZ80_002394 [Knufia obscura]KAK5948605.1 hypothetical protein OHC33_010364 [Knufia fluminis]